MCTVPPAIQSQIGEAIALIASSDFPKQWDNLLPDLIGRLNLTSQPIHWDVILGVLLTMNSIFKRFRYVQRSDALYEDILYVLVRLQEPITKLFLGLVGMLEGVNEKVECLAALRSTCRIFYSLNYQVSVFLSLLLIDCIWRVVISIVNSREFITCT